MLDAKLVGERLSTGTVGVGSPAVVARGVVGVEGPRLAQRKLGMQVKLKRQQAQRRAVMIGKPDKRKIFQRVFHLAKGCVRRSCVLGRTR